jgi:hypothetical protein
MSTVFSVNVRHEAKLERKAKRRWVEDLKASARLGNNSEFGVCYRRCPHRSVDTRVQRSCSNARPWCS